MACVLAVVFLAWVAWWTRQSTSTQTDEGKEAIIFWGNVFDFGEEIYAAIHQFELKNPQYKVIMSPDVVWFDRFAIGEWAGRGALEDLRPLIESPNPSKNPWDKFGGVCFSTPLVFAHRIAFASSCLREL